MILTAPHLHSACSHFNMLRSSTPKRLSFMRGPHLAMGVEHHEFNERNNLTLLPLLSSALTSPWFHGGQQLPRSKWYLLNWPLRGTWWASGQPHTATNSPRWCKQPAWWLGNDTESLHPWIHLFHVCVLDLGSAISPSITRLNLKSSIDVLITIFKFYTEYIGTGRYSTLEYSKFTFNASSCLRLYGVERGWRLISAQFDLLFQTNSLKQLQTTQFLSYKMYMKKIEVMW